MTQLVVRFCSDCFHTVAAVQSGSDLFICFNESLELDVQLAVLAGQHVAVLLECVDLSLNVLVAFLQGAIGESEIVLLAARGV